MTALTKSLRAEIVQIAVNKSGLLEKRRAAEAELFKQTVAYQREAYGPEKYDELLKAIRLVASAGSMQVYPFTHSINVKVDGRIISVITSHSNNVTDYVPMSSVSTPEISREKYQVLADLSKKASSFETQIKELRSKVAGALEAFKTVKALMQSWPEVIELLPATLGEAKQLPVVVNAAELNNIIGLPTGKKDA